MLKIFLEDRTVYVEKADMSKYASVITLSFRTPYKLD